MPYVLVFTSLMTLCECSGFYLESLKIRSRPRISQSKRSLHGIGPPKLCYLGPLYELFSHILNQQ